jgi:hypothetical protein
LTTHCFNWLVFVGAPFPSNFRDVVKTIFKRLFRVYAHIYHSHFQKIVSLKEEAHLNTCFKHFVLFTWVRCYKDKKFINFFTFNCSNWKLCSTDTYTGHDTDTDTSTRIIIWKDDTIQCNYKCQCPTLTRVRHRYTPNPRSVRAS